MRVPSPAEETVRDPDVHELHGLVPAEYSSGERTRRGHITKAGSEPVRTALTEAAWAYRHAPATGAGLRRRQQTRALLHDLTAVHHLVTELQGADEPDMGPRFEAKPAYTGSAATAAAGLGLLAAPPEQNAPARNLGLFGACLELAASHWMTRRIGMVAEPYYSGGGGMYMKAGEVLTVLGAIGSLASRRSRVVGALSGAALLAASAATRWGVFRAGQASANDPKYTVVPQRERLRQRHPGGEPS